MGGATNNNQQQQQMMVHYPYNQPQQQNTYFQPVPPQYLPQAYPEQPVLQGSSSSMYPHPVQAPLHQPVYVQPMPQPAYPVVQPIEQQQVQEDVTHARRCKFSCARLRQFFANLCAYRVCAFLTAMFTVAYFLFTPHAWPWFLTVASLCIGYCGTKYAKKSGDKIMQLEPRFFIHLLWYASLNCMFVLINLWSGVYPWSVFPLCLWGACVAYHGVKIYNQNQFKTRLYVHFIIYLAVMIILLVTLTRGRHTSPLIPAIILVVWSLILSLHAKKVRRDELRRLETGEPAELQVVAEPASVPQQSENIQMVQSQQEVYNSIKQAQEEQRAQANIQTHLFQPSLYPNVNNK
jgi:hypothetical protein